MVKRGTLAGGRLLVLTELMRLGGTIILSRLKQYSTIVNFKCREETLEEVNHVTNNFAFVE